MNSHASRTHARYGASSAHRWFACPGSVRLCEGLPDVPSEAALEGTRAHELLEALLRLQQNTFSSVPGFDRDDATKKWDAAPQDMRDAVHVCVDYVKEILEDHDDAVLMVEQRFEVPVAAAPGEVFGTCDVCVFVPSMRLLYVVDYKHGAGVFVDVRGNKQARFYGLGAIASIDIAFNDELRLRRDLTGHPMPIDTVALVIVQPRCPVGEPVREDWVPVEDVLAFGPEIGWAVERCKQPDAPLVPGEEQCRFCAAATICPAREAAALEACGADFGDVALVADAPGGLQAPRHVTGARLGELLRAKAVIVGWFDDLEAEALRRMTAGEPVKYHKLVEAQARRQWNEEDVHATAVKLSGIVGAEGERDVVEQFKVEKLRGLTEVERILKQGCDRKEARRRLDAMAYLTTKKSSGALKVAPEDDPRPAAVAGAAFDGVAMIPYVKETE